MNNTSSPAILLRLDLCILLVLSIVFYGVSQPDYPVYARYNDKGRMISIYRLCDSEISKGCESGGFTGSISNVEYDNKARIVAFQIQVKGVGKEQVYIDESLYRSGRIDSIDVARMPSLIKEQAKVEVGVFYCGASGRIKLVDEVELK